ncbi:MAG: methyltransferase [Candidatus Paceibacterota bacterium]
MDKDNEELNKEKKHISGVVHVLLSYSYVIFFLAVVFGVIFDIIFPIRILNGIIYEYIGIGFIIIGSILIYWAQATSRATSKTIPTERDINFFLQGPYKYTRNPTNLGLTLTVFGLGLLINSFFTVVFMLITYIISKVIFIKKQDTILGERYGNVFQDYRKKVRDWL